MRLNVFSGPKQRLCGYDEVVMGSESRADNTRVINTNRMALSMVGDESQACSYGGERNQALVANVADTLMPSVSRRLHMPSN